MALDGSSTVDDIRVGLQTVSIEPAATTNGAATIVDAQTGSSNCSKTYSRTTTQVLKIVTGSTKLASHCKVGRSFLAAAKRSYEDYISRGTAGNREVLCR